MRPANLRPHLKPALYAALVLLFGWFIWPTPYDYSHDGDRPNRRHRITNQVEMYRAGEWVARR